MKACSQRGPDVPLGGLLDASRLGQPGRREVVAQRGDLGLHGLVGGDVGGGEELVDLRPGGRAVGAEQQVRRAGPPGVGRK